MKIDLLRVRVAPVPETPFLLFFSFLAHCSHDLFFLSICPWAREHRATFSLLRATLHSITSILCVCVCVLIDFFFPFLYSSLVKQATTKERTNERTNDGAERKEKERREKLNYNHSAAIYIYILKSFIDDERRRGKLQQQHTHT
jgi:hypothetical protein